MKFDDIKVHEIARIKLSGERIYVASKGIDGSTQWVTGKRQIHSHETGDSYITETWEPEELVSEEQFQAENTKERSELLDALKSAGVMVLNDQSELTPPRDPHAN